MKRITQIASPDKQVQQLVLKRSGCYDDDEGVDEREVKKASVNLSMLAD
jgi:hypothetical protein